MSEPDDTHDDESSDDRYATFEAGDGSVVLYDRERPDAWIQSDFAVEIGAN